MANEQRLIYVNDALEILRHEADVCNSGFTRNVLKFVITRIDSIKTVDAIPVDDIKLHHILIDNEGFPEVKLQIGDRYFILRTDPVDVREVVHGRWIEEYVYDPDPHDRLCYKCSVCGRTKEYREPYCNCGEKMDG